MKRLIDGWIHTGGLVGEMMQVGGGGTDRQPSLTFALNAGVALVYLCLASAADS